MGFFEYDKFMEEIYKRQLKSLSVIIITQAIARTFRIIPSIETRFFTSRIQANSKSIQPSTTNVKMSTTIPTDLKTHTLNFLNLISNKRDLERAAPLIAPTCQFIHDDQSPKSRDEFLYFWPQMMAKAPNFHVEVKDIVGEGKKVWVFSKVTGRQDGTDCDDLHMFEWDDEGRCVKCHGVHRVIEIATGK